MPSSKAKENHHPMQQFFMQQGYRVASGKVFHGGPGTRVILFSVVPAQNHQQEKTNSVD